MDVIGDRRFGLWSMDEARALGYKVTPAAGEVAAIDATYPDSWWGAWRSCTETVEVIPLSTALSGERPDAVDIGMIESRQAAEADARWKTATDDWERCLEDHGISLAYAGSLSPVVPTDSEAAIDVATQDVTGKGLLGNWPAFGWKTPRQT